MRAYPVGTALSLSLLSLTAISADPQGEAKKAPAPTKPQLRLEVTPLPGIPRPGTVVLNSGADRLGRFPMPIARKDPAAYPMIIARGNPDGYPIRIVRPEGLAAPGPQAPRIALPAPRRK